MECKFKGIAKTKNCMYMNMISEYMYHRNYLCNQKYTYMNIIVNIFKMKLKYMHMNTGK